MYFGQMFVKNARILVRFSGKIGQIVSPSQILENFSQILIISTLGMSIGNLDLNILVVTQ